MALIDERTLDEHNISAELVKPAVKSLLEGSILGIASAGISFYLIAC